MHLIYFLFQHLLFFDWLLVAKSLLIYVEVSFFLNDLSKIYFVINRSPWFHHSFIVQIDDHQLLRGAKFIIFDEKTTVNKLLSDQLFMKVKWIDFYLVFGMCFFAGSCKLLEELLSIYDLCTWYKNDNYGWCFSCPLCRIWNVFRADKELDLSWYSRKFHFVFLFKNN